MAASAWAAHANAPVFIAVAREHNISPRHTRRQTVAFNDEQPPTRAEPRPCIAPPPLDLHRDRHRAGVLSIGKPSNGSASPRARRRFGARVNMFSATYSSSQAARLNCVRA